MDVTYQPSAIDEALTEVDRRRWLFDNLPLDPLHRDWLRRRAWVRTVQGTTRIEGNRLSDLEVDRLLDGLGTAALPRKDALDVLGTRSALEAGRRPRAAPRGPPGPGAHPRAAPPGPRRPE